MIWDGRFNGALGLAGKLATAPEAQECVVRNWFRFAYGRNELDTPDGCTMDTLMKAFRASGYKFRDLLATLAETDAFLYRRVNAGGAP